MADARVSRAAALKCQFATAALCPLTTEWVLCVRSASRRALYTYACTVHYPRTGHAQRGKGSRETGAPPWPTFLRAQLAVLGCYAA